MKENEDVYVVAFNKYTDYIVTTTCCIRKDAERYAKYYRYIGYNARILTYDELQNTLEKEKEIRFDNYNLHQTQT